MKRTCRTRLFGMHVRPARVAQRSGATGGRRRAVMLYATAVMLAVLITGSAMTLAAMAFADRRVRNNIADQRHAAMLARTGSEWILAHAATTPAWRANFQTAPTRLLRPNGPGRVDVTVTDGDGNLTDNDTQTVSITLTSRVNGLERRMKFDAQSNPHAALAYNMVGTNLIKIDGNCTINGPIYATSSITRNSGTVTTGAGASFNVPTGGSISGSLQPRNLNAKTIGALTPDLTFYTAKATSLPLSSSGSGYALERGKFTSTFNTYGAANAHGIYLVDMAGKKLSLRDIYVEGTLVIVNSGSMKDITIDGAVIFKTGTFGYPSLIINAGNAVVDMLIPASTLNESTVGADLNGDADQADSLTPYISGLVYAPNADITLGGSSWAFSGSFIAGVLTLKDGVVIGDGTTLSARRAPGFTDGCLYPIAGTASEVLP